MMDKQIEEMGVDVSIAWQKANHRRCTMGVTRPPLCDVLAEELAKMSYRKIPEDAVVLTREEYDGTGIVVEMSGGHKLKLSVGKFSEMSKILEEHTRKETAEKFVEMAKGAFFGVNCITFDEWNWYHDKLDEICKEITDEATK